jgi:hypothetical protein
MYDVIVVGGGMSACLPRIIWCALGEALLSTGRPGRATDAGAGILSPETNNDRTPGSILR